MAKHKFVDYILLLGSRGFLNWMSDESYLKMIYRLEFHQSLNLENPTKFNEKLQ